MATAKAQGTSLLGKLTRPLTNSWRFLREVRVELQRVVWPSHEETYSFTVIVLLACFIVAAWVALLDMIFAAIMSFLGIGR